MRAGTCKVHGDYLGGGYCPDCFLAGDHKEQMSLRSRIVALEARSASDAALIERLKGRVESHMIHYHTQHIHSGPVDRCPNPQCTSDRAMLLAVAEGRKG